MVRLIVCVLLNSRAQDIPRYGWTDYQYVVFVDAISRGDGLEGFTETHVVEQSSGPSCRRGSRHPICWEWVQAVTSDARQTFHP